MAWEFRYEVDKTPGRFALVPSSSSPGERAALRDRGGHGHRIRRGVHAVVWLSATLRHAFVAALRRHSPNLTSP
jgi:hypothetical protein